MLEHVIESMVAVVGERYRAHVRAAVLTRGPEVVAQTIEAAQDERGSRNETWAVTLGNNNRAWNTTATFD